MIDLHIKDWIDLIRSFVYLLAAIESSLVAYNYNFGYMNMKKTPVIGSIRNVFIALAVLFFYMAFVPVVKIFSPEAYIFAVSVIPVPILVLILHIRDFRHNSLTKVKKGKNIIVRQ
jgi:hypothetical protein